MADKQIALDLTAFLDSPHAKALAPLGPERIRSIARSFLEVCYDELGKKPRLLDGEDVHVALGHALPGRLKRKDPLAEHVPAVLRAYFAHLEESEVVPQVFEIRNALEATFDEFQETVRTGRNVHHGGGRKEAPFVHKAEKLGRNDPCSCGSGKKYKKCHGRNA